jgi:hypothetical protein
MKIRLTGMLLLLAIANTAQCNERESAIVGAGTASCGRYLEIRAMQDRDLDGLFSSWLQGFVSGANVQRREMGLEFVSVPDGPSMLAYIDKFCRDNPLKTVFEGAVVMKRLIR